MTDTRRICCINPFAPGESRTINLHQTVPPGATAVVLNVTATEPTEAGFLTVYPAGQPVPVASNVNFVAGQTKANTVTVGLSTVAFNNGSPEPGFNVLNALGHTHVLVDVQGFYTGDASTFTSPKRIMDTRQGGLTLGANAVRTIATGAPPDATGVALNVTVTNPTQPGYVTVFPTGQAVPTTSPRDHRPRSLDGRQ